MKNALLFTLLVFGLIACNNRNSPKENTGLSSTIEQASNSQEGDALLDATITADGLGSLKLGAKIPDAIPGYEVIFVIYEKEDDMEDVVVEVNKEDKLILQLRPGVVDETDPSNDTIAGILIISDQFATADGIHVGSSIHDILKKQGVTTYFNEKRFFIKDNGLTYILKPEEYEGELPTVPFDSPMKIEQPTFKADAKIRAIGVFGE